MIVDYYGAGIQTLERPTTRRNTEKDIARKIARSNRNKIGSRQSYDDELEIRRIPSIEKLNREKELEIERKKERIKAKAQNRKNVSCIMEIAVGFVILLGISYRYALINSTFNEKEKMKAELASIQKQNEQLKVNIEQAMNINTIEQEAKEKLGMQKLDNSQKVYVSLDKQDYIESSASTINNEENETWWSKLLKDLFKIK